MSVFLIIVQFYNMGCTFSVGRSVMKFCKIWTVTAHNIFFLISVLFPEHSSRDKLPTIGMYKLEVVVHLKLSF